MSKVTLLEPRTPHQPGKLRTCQRTSVFVPGPRSRVNEKQRRASPLKFNRVQPLHKEVTGFSAMPEEQVGQVRIFRLTIAGGACPAWRLQVWKIQSEPHRCPRCNKRKPPKSSAAHVNIFSARTNPWAARQPVPRAESDCGLHRHRTAVREDSPQPVCRPPN